MVKHYFPIISVDLGLIIPQDNNAVAIYSTDFGKTWNDPTANYGLHFAGSVIIKITLLFKYMRLSSSYLEMRT